MTLSRTSKNIIRYAKAATQRAETLRAHHAEIEQLRGEGARPPPPPGREKDASPEPGPCEGP